jgi:hypothetical protein
MVKLVAAAALTEVLLLIGWLVPTGVASRTMQPTPEGTEVSATLTSEKGLSLWELPVHAWPASAAHVTINTISVLRSLATKHLISSMLTYVFLTQTPRAQPVSSRRAIWRR